MDNLDIYKNSDLFLFMKLAESGYLDVAYVESPDIDFLLENGLFYIVSRKRWYASQNKENVYELTPAGRELYHKLHKLTHTIKAHYSEDHTCTREATDDGWDNGDYDLNSRYESFEVAGPEEKNTSPYYEDGAAFILEPKSVAYLVWSRYTSGSTFGHTSGKFSFEGIARTDAGVKALEKAAIYRHQDYFGGLDNTYTEVIEL